jgi:putative oxidoreductase
MTAFKVSREKALDLGLLALRVFPGVGLLVSHGWGKLMEVPGIFEDFASPIGLGPAVSAGLTIFAETLCAAAVALGFLTRWASVPIVIMFLVIALIHHADDPWDKKEFALIYAVPFVALIFTGGGRYALDTWMRHAREDRAS